MDTAALLIMVREGFEATLVISILAVYLRRIDRLDLRLAMWGGIVSALAVTGVAGVWLHNTIGGLEGVWRMRAFGIVSLLAVVVLTWMIFWMRKQSRAIKGEIHSNIDSALTKKRVGLTIAFVAFIAVLRESFEAVLFLVAATTDSSGTAVLIGAGVGLAIAVFLGWLVTAGGRKLPMKSFFTVTGMIIVIFAAGLLARSVLFFQSAGDLGSMNDAVYNLTMYPWLTQSTESGKFLAALLGWDPRPSIEQVIAWAAYIIPVSYFFLRKSKSTAPATITPAPKVPEQASR